MTSTPQATVVVPSYNRPERLRDCLEALARLEGPSFEVVVVDDGSTTPLGDVAGAFGPGVRCLRQENRGPAAARNTGARAAAAPFVAMTDDDCRPRPGWLAALMSAHGGHAGRLVGGLVVNGLPDNVYAAASQSLCDFLYDWFGADAGEAPFFTSNNMGCTRDAFLESGGFDESFPLAAAEDRDFGLRWRERGELLLAPDAVVEHFHSLDLRRFWRQHANYGRGARRLHEVMDARGDPRPRREPLAFYYSLVLHPLRRPGRGRLAQSVLMALSQAAMVRGYAGAARVPRNRGS